MRRFRQDEQQPPEAQRIADGVIMRLEHVLEVDPELMETHFRQQTMPVWDTERIVDSRWEHLDWMHGHFADELLVAGVKRGLVKFAGQAEKVELPRGRLLRPRGQPLPQLVVGAVEEEMAHHRGDQHRAQRDAERGGHHDGRDKLALERLFRRR